MAKKIKFVTPKGRAKYPWLNKPDTQFSAEGVYSTYLIMDPKDAADFRQLVKDTAAAEFGPTAKYSTPIEIDEETGDVVAKFKSTFQPHFKDSAGQVILPEELPSLFGGSVIAVSGELAPYTVQGKKGVSLRLKFVQIIDPVGPKGGGENPFAAVEGGFVKSDAVQDAELAEGDDDFDF